MANLGFSDQLHAPVQIASDKTDNFAVVLHLPPCKWRQSPSPTEQGFFSRAAERRKCYFLEALHRNRAVQRQGWEPNGSLVIRVKRVGKLLNYRLILMRKQSVRDFFSLPQNSYVNGESWHSVKSVFPLLCSQFQGDHCKNINNSEHAQMCWLVKTKILEPS